MNLYGSRASSNYSHAEARSSVLAGAHISREKFVVGELIDRSYTKSYRLEFINFRSNWTRYLYGTHVYKSERLGHELEDVDRLPNEQI